jgi:hypothetical protein
MQHFVVSRAYQKLWAGAASFIITGGLGQSRQIVDRHFGVTKLT